MAHSIRRRLTIVTTPTAVEPGVPHPGRNGEKKRREEMQQDENLFLTGAADEKKKKKRICGIPQTRGREEERRTSFLLTDRKKERGGGPGGRWGFHDAFIATKRGEKEIARDRTSAAGEYFEEGNGGLNQNKITEDACLSVS